MLQGEVIFVRKSEGIKRELENMHRPEKLRISALKINIRRQTFDSRLNQYIVSHKKNHLRDRGAKIGKGTKQHPGKLEKRGEKGEKV